METIFITWTSWFIGFHLSETLLKAGYHIIWLDNENDYYDVKLKKDRRAILEKYEKFKFYHGKLENQTLLEKIFSENSIDKVCNLAAQAWVRYSLENPHAYINANLLGFHNLLALSQQHKVKNFVYASSSSVYGNNEKQPFSVDDNVDKPISVYAATKKSNELIAHVYSHLYKLPTIGLRFFTVYGPYGRPDMAPFIFADKISRWKTIDVYNFWKCKRDFTYIDDIVDGIIKSLDLQWHIYEIFNLWNDNPNELEDFISLIEKNIWKKADKNYMELQPGDVPETWADLEYTKQKLWWEPKIKLEAWIEKFIVWFKDYYLNK